MLCSLELFFSILIKGCIVFEPPTPDQGARKVWSDSQGKIGK